MKPFIESRKDGGRVATFYVYGILGHISRECSKKEGALCNICKPEGHLNRACREKGKRSVCGGSNRSLASTCAVSESFELKKNNSVFDSGTTDHFVFDRILFVDFRDENELILGPNGGYAQIEGIGRVLVEIFNQKGQKVRLHLDDVAYVTQYKFNLISIDKISRKGIQFCSGTNRQV